MTAPRRDLPVTPRMARLLGPRPPRRSRRTGLDAEDGRVATAIQIEEIVAAELARTRGTVSGTERRAAHLGALIALQLRDEQETTRRSGPSIDRVWVDETREWPTLARAEARLRDALVDAMVERFDAAARGERWEPITLDDLR